jgi:hypothetical protein
LIHLDDLYDRLRGLVLLATLHAILVVFLVHAAVIKRKCAAAAPGNAPILYSALVFQHILKLKIRIPADRVHQGQSLA